MSFKTVCRLCLSTGAPVRAIVGTPLQEVYERLTNVSLNSSHKPVVACCLCYWQLRKSHKLMSRALRADELLNKILRTGASIKRELITAINRTTYKLNDDLSISPTKLDFFKKSKHITVEREIKVEPFSYQNEDETDEQMSYVGDIKVEIPDIWVEADGNEDVSDAKKRWTDGEEMYGERDAENNVDIKNLLIESFVRIDGAVPAVTRGQQRPRLVGTKDHTQHNNYTTTHDTDGEEDHSNYNDHTERYLCKICRRKFDKKCNLERHITTHTGEKPFECCTCRKKFNRKAHLQIHTRTHSGEKPYACEICKRRFSQKPSLNRHLKLHFRRLPF